LQFAFFHGKIIKARSYYRWKNYRGSRKNGIFL